MDDLIETNENSILDFQKTLQSAFEMLKGVKKNNSNLVIFFHGALPNINDRDCFRGIDYNIYI